MNYLNVLNEYVEKGLLKRQVSQDGKLVLYDYTEKCQFERAWDEVTLNHRGTVYELSTGKIVARSFPKFFNFSELSPNIQKQLLQSDSFEVRTKMDGSLGIVYWYEDSWRINTRGSFNSDQAIKGLELLNKKNTENLNKNYTYLVEIIYPENRIVVDYKGIEDLVLLAVYHTEKGYEFDISTVQSCFEKEAPACVYDSIEQVLNRLSSLSSNEEGYVIKFRDGTRAKFKGEEYVRLHRIISGLSPLALWEVMVDGKVPDEFMATIPEEFRQPYEEIREKLEARYSKIQRKTLAYITAINNCIFNGNFQPTPENKKTLGLYTKEHENHLTKLVFPCFLNNNKVVDKLFKDYIRPSGNIL